MVYTLTFTDRERYCKACKIIEKNTRYKLIYSGRDYGPNLIRPWSSLFYVAFMVRDQET